MMMLQKSATGVLQRGVTARPVPARTTPQRGLTIRAAAEDKVGGGHALSVHEKCARSWVS